MIEITEPQLTGLMASVLLPFFRILGLFTSAPVLSQRAMPARARVSVALLIGFIVAPSVQVPAELIQTDLLPAIIHETVLGLLLGFVARVIFTAFEIAGEAIGLQMGLSFAGFFDPQSGASNPVSRFLNLTALTSFVALNGPGLLLVAVVASFAAVPVGTDWLAIASHSPVQFGSQMFSLALGIALPFIALLLFANLTLGIMSRVAPQFSVFVVGFPVTIGSGLVLLTVGYPLFSEPIDTAIAAMVQALQF